MFSSLVFKLSSSKKKLNKILANVKSTEKAGHCCKFWLFASCRYLSIQNPGLKKVTVQINSFHAGELHMSRGLASQLEFLPTIPFHVSLSSTFLMAFDSSISFNKKWCLTRGKFVSWGAATMALLHPHEMPAPGTSVVALVPKNVEPSRITPHWDVFRILNKAMQGSRSTSMYFIPCVILLDAGWSSRASEMSPADHFHHCASYYCDMIDLNGRKAKYVQ